MRRALGEGDHHRALDLFHPPVAPRCDGEALRLIAATSGALRESIMADAGSDALLRYLALPQAAEDADAWRLALQLLPADAPQRAMIVAHVEELARPAA